MVFYPDQGRLEIEGQHLAGVRLRWETAKGSGTDVCVEPTAAAGRQRCIFSVPRTLSADVRFDWAPAAAMRRRARCRPPRSRRCGPRA